MLKTVFEQNFLVKSRGGGGVVENLIAVFKTLFQDLCSTGKNMKKKLAGRLFETLAINNTLAIGTEEGKIIKWDSITKTRQVCNLFHNLWNNPLLGFKTVTKL